MKFTHALLAAFVVLMTPIVGCHRQDPKAIQSLRWLEKADPIADAKKALAIGDHRLRAVNGLTVSIPGTDRKDFDSFQRKYGINAIEGTTDGLINKEHRRLALMAIKYSEIYNRQILGDNQLNR
jgi:hypothetical protein